MTRTRPAEPEAQPPAPMKPKELRAFIAAHAWRTASTMPTKPHAYTLRKNAPDDADFVRFVVNIRAHGYRGKYGRSTYTYLDVDGYQYWTMGSPLNQTILINRAALPSAAAGAAEEAP